MDGSGTGTIVINTAVSNAVSLFDLLLQVARFSERTYNGTTTGAGSTTTLVDSELNPPRSDFEGGSLFITSGVYINNICKIVSINAGTITFTPALADAPGLGNTYYISRIPKNELIDAVNKVLRTCLILKSDSTLTIVANQEEYTLPAGVANIVRVEIAVNPSVPYSYQRNLNWKEQNGKLIWDVDYVPAATEGNIIRIWYYAPHGELDSLTDVTEVEANVEYIKWQAIVNFLRTELQTTKRDDPVIIDLLNEAKANVAVELGKIRPVSRDCKIL